MTHLSIQNVPKKGCSGFWSTTVENITPYIRNHDIDNASIEEVQAARGAVNRMFDDFLIRRNDLSNMNRICGLCLLGVLGAIFSFIATALSIANTAACGDDKASDCRLGLGITVGIINATWALLSIIFGLFTNSAKENITHLDNAIDILTKEQEKLSNRYQLINPHPRQAQGRVLHAFAIGAGHAPLEDDEGSNIIHNLNYLRKLKYTNIK